MNILTREEVERICHRLEYPTGAGGEKEPALRAILEHDAAQRARIKELEEEVKNG